MKDTVWLWFLLVSWSLVMIPTAWTRWIEPRHHGCYQVTKSGYPHSLSLTRVTAPHRGVELAAKSEVVRKMPWAGVTSTYSSLPLKWAKQQEVVSLSLSLPHFFSVWAPASFLDSYLAPALCACMDCTEMDGWVDAGFSPAYTTWAPTLFSRSAGAEKKNRPEFSCVGASWSNVSSAQEKAGKKGMSTVKWVVFSGPLVKSRKRVSKLENCCTFSVWVQITVRKDHSSTKIRVLIPFFLVFNNWGWQDCEFLKSN